MANKKMGAMSTGEMIGIGVLGAAVLYFALQPKPVTPAPIVYRPLPVSQGSSTATDIAAGAGLLTSLLNQFSDNS